MNQKCPYVKSECVESYKMVLGLEGISNQPQSEIIQFYLNEKLTDGRVFVTYFIKMLDLAFLTTRPQETT